MPVSQERCNISLTNSKQEPEEDALMPHTSFYLHPSFPEIRRQSSGQEKFKIVLDFVVMVVDMVSVSLAEVTHESQVVGGHEVAEALKSSSDRNTKRRLRIKPHTLFLISHVSECVSSESVKNTNTKLTPKFGVCVCVRLMQKTAVISYKNP